MRDETIKPPTKIEPPWAQEGLRELVEILRQAHGLDLYPYDQSFLAATLDKRLATTGLPTAAAYVARLASDRREAENLLQSLNIVYSEFFRNPLAFALLEQLILPSLLDAKVTSGRGELRLWSTGCATGQEVWSVAILLAELTGGMEQPLPYRILASDLSAADLAVARVGNYSSEAVGNVRSAHLRKYFCRQGDTYMVVPRLRERVEFTVYDLLDEGTICPPESIFGDFDLVLCSNLLFYYRPKMRRLILDKIRRSLAPGGFLVTDPTERHLVLEAGGFRQFGPPVAVFAKN